MRFLLVFACFLFCTFGHADSTVKPLASEYRYRLSLADKNGSPYSIDNPEAFLSAKSIARRQKFGVSVDHHDLPIVTDYLQQIESTGVQVFNMSKWNNTVQVTLSDTTTGVLSQLRALPFVTDCKLVYVAPDSAATEDAADRQSKVTNEATKIDHYYGHSKHQIEQLNLQHLHQMGYLGQGMTVAILDGGFHNVDCIKGFEHTKILGVKNFARPHGSVFEEHPHGMNVLSCIGANMPHVMMGTAPYASYYLIQSEDTRFEYEGEQDNWCAALEYADSLGVDVVTSSLGYTYFETPRVMMHYRWLDGHHQLISRSASLAASRGILLCNSAGNEGDERWKKIGFPADGRDMLTVGAVDSAGVNTAFSSVGFTADGRIKPDCMAMGLKCSVYDTTGAVSTANGTSFSCPIMAGAVTCLMQACPSAKPQEVIDAVHHAGNNIHYPDEIYGYGIPDMLKAYDWLRKAVEHPSPDFSE